MDHDEDDIRQAVNRLIRSKGPERTHVLEVLQGIQERYHHVPREAAEEIRRRMGVSVAETYGLVTFYDLLTVKPQGTHVLRICDDVICHLKGAPDLIRTATERIGPEGQPDADGDLSWESCACLGLCAGAPAATRDGVPVAPIAPAQIRSGDGDE